MEIYALFPFFLFPENMAGCPDAFSLLFVYVKNICLLCR